VEAAGSAAVELRHLRAFLAVAEELSFTRAARRTFVAQQTLSDTVAQLERHVGVQLFERSTRFVRLSEAGERFVPHVRSILVAVDDAMGAARTPDDERELVAVGMLTTSAIDVRADLLGALSRSGAFRFQTVSFDFTDPSCGLLDRSTQIAFTVGPIDHPDLEAHVVYAEPRFYVMSASHPLVQLAHLDADVVESYPAAALENQHQQPFVQRWSDFWQLQPSSTGERRRVGWVGRDLEAWLAALASSDGVASVPASFSTLYQRPDLVYREAATIAPCEHLFVHRRDQRDLPVVHAILERIR
jgi:DNA-binding transcriptional LysR family regulator